MSVSANIGAIWAWSSQETAATGESRTVVELLVAVADELDPPRSLSPTSARTWQQCELRYALSYLYGWQEGATLPQVVGNTVHRAVELLYGLDPSQRRRDVAGQLLRVALAEETGRDEVAALVERREDLAGQVTSAGEDALEGLFVLEDPARITVDPEGLEVRVVAELYGVPVRGRIDRLYDASGAYVVADYKSGRVPRPAYTATAFFGLWTYAAALAASDPDRVLPDRVELLYLVGRERLARPVVRAVALHHARDLARIWRQILSAVQRAAVTARTSLLCDWCAFSSVCPARTKAPLPGVGSDEHAALVGALGLHRRDRSSVAKTLERAESPGEHDDPESAR
jgi:putative RecB family exonuclease